MNEHKTSSGSGAEEEAGDLTSPPKDPREAIVEALLELASERNWDDITISDVATRANLSLSTFRDYFPSKGAILASFFRKIDKAVLDAPNADLAGEPAKERLFDVLMRRLDALAPYKLGVESIFDWTRRDPIAAAAVNRLTVNSMRFMLEAAGIESEGAVGAVKLQGLALAWARILPIWFRDDDSGLATTMAALDRELTRGASLVARAEDLNRLAAPLFTLTRSLFDSRRTSRQRAEKEDAGI
ncbi:transcriptional regulator, TetR family [Methylocella silvestris BL2]|uniref:Transcriptional regulator, TetR family n=1 Tax=Methylocella silvestris (strain DSM 15510 / CIP 108128 / LMG 27833 / NCIMB 13906 / BL2) TaxID=395965 RepID=B8ENH8_METSB|nr:TetR/AcrR family transcriptional regulator [Methylocella silvestris]ACK50109.1 transcriptional regulator, TetR family [Methylocella silvestris BL2]